MNSLSFFSHLIIPLQDKILLFSFFINGDSTTLQEEFWNENLACHSISFWVFHVPGLCWIGTHSVVFAQFACILERGFPVSLRGLLVPRANYIFGRHIQRLAHIFNIQARHIVQNSQVDVQLVKRCLCWHYCYVHCGHVMTKLMIQNEIL